MNDSENTTRHVAIDLGAESGRVMVGAFDGERVTLYEAHRFPNTPLQIGDELHWDYFALRDQIEVGLGKALAFGQPVSIGIDAWGCDYALMQEDGAVLDNPFHYRDPRTTGMPDEVFAIVPEAEVYAATGSQTLRFNTIFQLMAEKESGTLDHAASMMLMPDTLSFWLCGHDVTETTIASTTQLFDPRVRDWAWPLIDRLELPRDLFLPIEEPGMQRGKVRRDIQLEVGIESDPEVIAVASHDTASAVVASMLDARTMFISSGTWSLAGVETDEPVITDGARLANFTNEAGAERTNRFLRNACGLWLVQECRRIWNAGGHTYAYDDLTEMALAAMPLQAVFDPDDADFLLPERMPDAIRSSCEDSGRLGPDDHGSIIRAALESLALNYRHVLEDVERLTGRQIERIQIVGGGSQNRLHCQFTADATQRPVIAGPAEATALGNVMVQAKSLGRVTSLDEIREVIERSFDPVVYQPSPDRDEWGEAYQTFLTLKGRTALEG